MITGYNDVFARTVASGLGTATSGQAYTTTSTASQYSVSPGTASIVPTTASADRLGYVDRQTSDIDITGQVALSGIPATNLMTVGFVVKLASTANYYNATMMVSAGGAISLRFSKVISGGTVTIATVATGLTYVPNAVYNLRAAVFWSNALQTNVLMSKLWASGGTEPGGWMASATDAALTQYTSGTGAGIMARDEAAAPGTVTAKIQNVAAKTYGLPVPSGADPMCFDPSIAYPKQTALKSLADATDAVMAALDPTVSLAALFPRVRVSAANWTLGPTLGTATPTYTATEFNLGTATNLGYDNTALYLPVGIWFVTYEIQLGPAALADYASVTLSGGFPLTSATIHMRTNTLQPGLDSQGGSGHVSCFVYSTDASLNVTAKATITPISGTASYPVKYSALSALKISDYFV